MIIKTLRKIKCHFLWCLQKIFPVNLKFCVFPFLYTSLYNKKSVYVTLMCVINLHLPKTFCFRIKFQLSLLLLNAKTVIIKVKWYDYGSVCSHIKRQRIKGKLCQRMNIQPHTHIHTHMTNNKGCGYWLNNKKPIKVVITFDNVA